MHSCHGRQSCTVDADRQHFDLPSNCSTQAPASLKAAFACVPAKILKSRVAATTTTTTGTPATSITTQAQVKDHEEGERLRVIKRRECKRAFRY